MIKLGYQAVYYMLIKSIVKSDSFCFILKMEEILSLKSSASCLEIKSSNLLKNCRSFLCVSSNTSLRSSSSTNLAKKFTVQDIEVNINEYQLEEFRLIMLEAFKKVQNYPS